MDTWVFFVEAWHSAKLEDLCVSGRVWLGPGGWDSELGNVCVFLRWNSWTSFPCLNNFLVVLIPFLGSVLSSQVFLAGLARQSMARMETEDLQGLQERLGDLAGQALWGYQVSVSLLLAWELQPIPLLASQSLGLSRGHEQPARTEPISIQGHLWVDMHPSPRRLDFSGSCLETQAS